jgi:UDP-N-acetylglucosamine--N-acetylmuramyl-(pentapeptide) pyrophosphoryl-undecaprenol N-acetylglucosamine transferase
MSDNAGHTQSTVKSTVTSAGSDPLRGRLIAFTGGGSAGHVTPNLALIEALRARGGRAVYLGRDHAPGAQSVERALVEAFPDLPFLALPAERLRRYFDWRNFTMPFTVLRGLWRAYWHIRAARPDALFSKGGFVSLPAVIGAWLNGVPVILHESDGSLGLAHRLSLPFAHTVCVAQARALKGVRHKRALHTGAPIRAAFLSASPEAARARFSLTCARPLLVIFGGSLGSAHLNAVTREALSDLLGRYEVFHVCGGGGVSAALAEALGARGYHQAEYVREGFADLLAAAHLVVGRAGANTLAELLLLRRPALVVPLPTASSRGDQLLNAQEHAQAGFGLCVRDEDLDAPALLNALERLEGARASCVEAMGRSPHAQGAEITLDAIARALS